MYIKKIIDMFHINDNYFKKIQFTCNPVKYSKYQNHLEQLEITLAILNYYAVTIWQNTLIIQSNNYEFHYFLQNILLNMKHDY